MKNIIIFIIGLYFISCGGSSNKNASELWKDGQGYRNENNLKESITSYKSIIDIYPSDDLSAEAQFQIADIYLNDVKDYDFALIEFQKVFEQIQEHFLKKSKNKKIVKHRKEIETNRKIFVKFTFKFR